MPRCVRACVCAGIVETLEAEVRSKFQTSRRMNDATQGEAVSVPFDETIVQYLWVGQRDFEIVGVELKSRCKTLLLEQEKLGDALLSAESIAAEEVTFVEEGEAGSVLIEEPAF
jgi:hypothetical protein